MKFLKIPLFLLAFTPLVYFPDTLFPYVFPKTLFIRLMVTIFWVGFAALLFYPHKSAGISINQGLGNPIFLAVSAFILLAAISTLFAVNPFRALWGDIERGEGLVGLLSFFGFFSGALLVFSRRDWNVFFGLTLATASALFIDQLWVLIARKSLWTGAVMQESVHMAGSLTGNPTFLAGFYLFAIFAGAMFLIARGSGSPKARTNLARIGRAFPYAVIWCAALGIFLTTTRGAIAGLGAGIIAVLLFFAFSKHKSAEIPKQSDTRPDVTGQVGIHQRLRKWSLLGLLLCAAFAAVFVITRHAALWQNIPGLNDIARLSAEDPTLRTRMISAGSSLAAVNPANEGILRLLVGWGQENFSVAYNAYYDPVFLRYEHTWFDRAHNKIFDVLVMNGALGLLAYLVIWVFVLRAILRVRAPESAALLFFGVAYFAQNLFVFDQVSTYVPFFAFLAYVVFRAQNATEPRAEPPSVMRAVPAMLAAILSSAILIVTFIGFRQTAQCIGALRTNEVETILRSYEACSVPYTFAQTELRASMLNFALGRRDFDQPAVREIFIRSLRLAKDAADREATSPRMFLAVASGYEFAGDLSTAEEYREKALALTPRRQDVLYAFGLTYARQGRAAEAMSVADRMLALDPISPRPKIYYATILTMTGGEQTFREATDLVFEAIDGPVRFSPGLQDLEIIRNLFQFYIGIFYTRKDEAKFLEAMERAKAFEERYEALLESPPDRYLSKYFARGIEAFQERGWSAIREQEQE